MPDNTLSTLGNIRTKVRRLTRSPSASQLSDSDIDSYVNNFLLYDLPSQLQLFSLRKSVSFYTEPYIDTYSTVDAPITHPLYNFINKYTSVHKQCVIAGFNVLLSQSREQFFGIYPKVESIYSIGTGNGVAVNFVGTLQTRGVPLPVLRNYVLFSSVDVNANGLSVIDAPVAGSQVANLVDSNTNNVVGTINYLTGAYNITFPVAPGAGAQVMAQVYPYQPSRPQAMLYYDDSFILRPVPDMPYKVEIEVYVRPTELLAGNDMPDISQWWQYIAYGAAKKVFEDRLDSESIQRILPEFKQQELFVLRRTNMTLENERSSTIYTEQVDLSSGISGWGGNNV